MRRHVALIALLGGGLLGCTAGRSANTTWEQDRSDGVATSTWGEKASATKLAVTAKTIDHQAGAAMEDYAARARELELVLMHFGSQARAQRQKSAEWTPELVARWNSLLNSVEEGLKRPLGVYPRRLMIQARVTMETELEIASRAHGAVPVHLADRSRKLYARIAAHMLATPVDAPDTPSRHPLRLSWPVTPLIVTSSFGYRRDPILGARQLRFHAGLDLGGRRGDIVAAAAPGRVSGAGWSGGHGRTITIQHAGGYVTRYAHLKRIVITPGTRVQRGTPIGLMGSSGRSTGPHLHFEVSWGSVPVDPLELLSDHQLARR